MGPWAMRRHPIMLIIMEKAAGAGNVWRGCHLRRGACRASHQVMAPCG
jgi:hypothetical protein